MSSRVTRSTRATAEQTEAANVLLSLSRAATDKPVVKKSVTHGNSRKFQSIETLKEDPNTMILRDRSKLKTPNTLTF
jgi:hypothetical protein